MKKKVTLKKSSKKCSMTFLPFERKNGTLMRSSGSS